MKDGWPSDAIAIRGKAVDGFDLARFDKGYRIASIEGALQTKCGIRACAYMSPSKVILLGDDMLVAEEAGNHGVVMEQIVLQVLEDCVQSWGLVLLGWGSAKSD